MMPGHVSGFFLRLPLHGVDLHGVDLHGVDLHGGGAAVRLTAWLRAAALGLALGVGSGVAGFSWALPALAVEPDEVLADPALEARARAISRDLRCLVCQNQSIDDSNAPLARDLRILVRERLVAGDSNEEVVEFVTVRYGDYVLLRPPFQPNTYALWFGPAIVLVLGALGVGVYLTRQKRRGGVSALDAPLDAWERRRLDALLDDEGERGGER